jgi:hypothetical protein
MIIYWQFVLFMQVVEGFAWVRIEDDKDIKILSTFAMVSNALQPFVLLLVVRYGLKEKIKYAGVANFMYFLLLFSDRIWIFTDIRPENGCAHLSLRYWTTARSASYILASLITFWEIPRLFWSLINMGIFLSVFLMPVLFTSCGVGYSFRWIICASGPIIVVAYNVERLCIAIQNTRMIISYILNKA